MRVLATGGAGFVGSHLVDRLVGTGHDLYVLDNFSTGKMKNLSNVTGSRNLKILRADIRRIPQALVRRRFDRVCHLAAVTSVQESIKNPAHTSDVNVIGTLRVLEAARKSGAERVVFASSAAVYGVPSSFPIKEDASVAPISPYGASKAASELYCKAFEENHGIEAVSVRYFNLYGPGQASSQYSGVISIFAKRLLRGLPLTIFGDGSQTRDFVFVEDAVDGTVTALEKSTLRGRVFNIASGKETRIIELAQTMKEIAEMRSALRFEPRRKGEIRRSLADITKAEAELGFRPAMRLRDGLSGTIEWFSHQT
jgi:UDP-glucose 4-epimerase